MRLGIAGLLPRNIEEIDVQALRKVRQMGFSGSQIILNNHPGQVPVGRAREIAKMSSDEGVTLVEYGQYQTDLVHSEPAVRKENVANLQAALRVAKYLGGPAVITGSGSLNPKGQWYPHAQNHSLAVLERLFVSLREAAQAAEQEGVLLALECHAVTALKDAVTARQVIDAVGSPCLKVHLDPVNWLMFDTVYDNATAIAAMFATLGPQRMTGAVHSKGIVVEDRLICHMSETHTGGDGDLIDHAALLRHTATLPGDPFVVIEHLPVELMPAARDHLLGIAEQIGIRFA